MQKRTMTIVAALTVGALVALLAGTYAVSTVNSEVSLRNAIEAKQQDNRSEYDSLWKKITQAAQVTDAQKAALLEVVTAYAAARGGGGDDGAVVRWIQESVPDVDTSTFNNLQNIIAGSRDRFAMRQGELLALKADHDTLLESFPSGSLLAMLGREPIDVTVLTSTRTEDTFRRGVEDDVTVPFGGE